MNVKNLIAIAATGLIGAGAHGQVFEYQFPLNGEQEVPPVMTAGTGFAFVALDASAGRIKWEIKFADLTGPATGAHFHGPAAIGETAGVRLNIGAISGLESPMVGSTDISAPFAQELIDGLWYINIHTARHPGGEIRGQVLNETACYADCDDNGELDFFDFLCFQNAFSTSDPYADCDGNGAFDFFDFLCFQNEFAAGCP